MFKYKQLIVGLISGIVIATGTSIAFAEDGLQKIEAYLRPDLPITLNGQKVALNDSPVMYQGNTYIRLRNLQQVDPNLNVNWNEQTQTVEISSNGTVTGNTYGSAPVSATSSSTTSTQFSIPSDYHCDGSCTIDSNGTKYIQLKFISDTQLKKGYKFKYDEQIKNLSIVYEDEGGVVSKTILSGIPTTILNGSSYTDYDYFINNILPIK